MEILANENNQILTSNNKPLTAIPGNPVTSVNGQVGDVVLSLTNLDGDASHRSVSDSEKASWNNKQEPTSNSLDTSDKTLVGAINEVNSLAKGASAATVYTSYAAMVAALNALSASDLKKGGNIYIITKDVPDLWIAKVEESSTPYTYTNDAAVIAALTGDITTTLQVGYFRLCALDTEKADLSDVVRSTSSILTSGSGNVITSLSIDENGNITLNLGFSAAPAYQYGNVDIGEEASLATGTLYFVYQ